MKLLIKILIAASIVAVSAASNANLIVNGSFEDSNVGNNQWKWFTADNVNGWEGSTIEIWNNYQNFAAYDGVKYAELNAHNNGNNVFSIFQTFSTVQGASYDVSFAYAARTGNNEKFSYAISSGVDLLNTQIINNDLVKSWTLFNTSFIATGISSEIMFTSIVPSTGTMGNFLDDVRVTFSETLGNATDVSAPASIALVFAGLFGLMFARKLHSSAK